MVMAAAKFLAGAAACIILLSLAGKTCQLYGSGLIKDAIVICQKFFSIFGLVIFFLVFLLKMKDCLNFFLALAMAPKPSWSCNFCCHDVQENFSV